MSNKEKFIKLLEATKLFGMDRLLEVIEDGGFYTSPCSTKHHLCKEGGLLEHSLNVFEMLCRLNEATGADLDYTDMVVCALLHDLGKMGDYGKPNYIDNVLKTGISKAQPYKDNPELTYEEHEIRSVVIASRCIELTEEQMTAILHHNGLFGLLDYGKGKHNHDKTKLAYLLHVADMYCSRFVECGVEGGDE